MFKGLGKLIWVELKIFMREPMGAFGTLVVPVILFIILARVLSQGSIEPPKEGAFVVVRLPVIMTILIAVNSVLSLTTIITIYREGGILKRLRATPLQPHTILTAHVIVKLILTSLTLLLLVIAGKSYIDAPIPGNPISFLFAVAISLVSILSIGFVIASVVPTARFAQLIAGTIFYPMLFASGLFIPIENLPPLLAKASVVLPLTHAVSLMEGTWKGDPWSDHLLGVFALALTFVLCTAISTKTFKWE